MDTDSGAALISRTGYGQRLTLRRLLRVHPPTWIVRTCPTQSNHEGALIDKLHESIDRVQGALVNPAGLTQHGMPLHDAIKAMPFPVIEVHMSNIAAREPWRAHSIISPAVRGTVQGLGWRSYTAALRVIAELAAEPRSTPKETTP